MKRFIVFTILVLGAANAAAMNLEAFVEGDHARLSLVVEDEFRDAYAGLVVTRRPIGTCENAVVATDGVVPFPVVWSGTGYVEIPDTVLTCPLPYADMVYVFKAWLVDADGGYSAFPATPWLQNSSSADGLRYGDGIVMRGELQALPVSYGDLTGYDVYVLPCVDGCWGAGDPILVATFTSAEDPLVQSSWQGVMDIHGTLNEMTDMPVPGPYLIESVEPAPDRTCGAVPVEQSTFGGLNALYR